MCGNCKYINKDSLYIETVYEDTKSERIEIVGYCTKYKQEVWINKDECTNYEEE